MTPILLALLIGSAEAAELDLSKTVTTGCDSQWTTECLPNDVWGPDASLAIGGCGKGNALWMDGMKGQITAVGFEKEPLNGATKLLAFVSGIAASPTSTVTVEIKYFNFFNMTVGSDSTVLHAGAAGLFSATHSFTGIPASAKRFQARLVVENDGVVIYKAGCAGPDGNRDPQECTLTCYYPDGETFEHTGYREGSECCCCPSGECDPQKWPEGLEGWPP